MKNIVRRPVWVALLLAAGLVASAQAASTPVDFGNKPASAKKKKSGGQVGLPPDSAETAKERSSRLKRECQGGVNAGACAGYTR